MKPTGDDISEDIERHILQIVRGLGRRNLGRGIEQRLEGMLDFSQVAIVDALAEFNDGRPPPTVGQLARRAGVDPSRASRMTAKAIRAGYAVRLASQEDGRELRIALTKKGAAFAAAVGKLRRKYFLAHLKEFSEAERATFAALLHKFLSAGREREQREDPQPGTAAVLQHPATAKLRRDRTRRNRSA